MSTWPVAGGTPRIAVARMPWHLLARQTASTATPTSAHPRDTWGAIGASPVDDNFSVLGSLRAQFGSGPWTFKMKWPELDGGENIWQQSSAPDQTLGRGATATGYRAVDIKYSGCGWAGLQKCDNSAYVCALRSNGNWWFPIGTDVGWAGGDVSFPGPCGAGDQGHDAKKVELWVWVSDWGRDFILASFVILAVYVLGGLILGQRAGAGKGRGSGEGARQLLQSHPHWSLWTTLHGLVIDGVNFARGGRGGSNSSSSGGGSGGTQRNQSVAALGGSDRRASLHNQQGGRAGSSSSFFKNIEKRDKSKEKKSKRGKSSGSGDPTQGLLADQRPATADGDSGGDDRARSRSGYRGDEWSAPPKPQLQSGARETGVAVKY